MRLKILFIPLLIVLVMVLAIGFIQPDVVSMQEKKIQIVTQEAKVNSIESVLKNIGTLTSSLDSNAVSEEFVRNYFPKEMDQERVIDAINFSAVQSGVLVEGMDIVQPSESVALQQVNTLGADVPFDMGVNADGSPIVPEIIPRTFSAKITVRGNYENIKNFISRSAHMSRYYSLKGFSVGLSDRDQGSETADAVDGLEGVFYADFDYLKMQKTNSALSNDIFKSSTLEFSPLQSTIDWVTNTIPLLEKPATGKSNPFL